MFGTEQGQEASRGEQRKSLLDARDKRILQFMQEQRPVAAIAELEGLEPDYCRKATRRLAAEHGVDYQPVKGVRLTPLGDASREFRNRLANFLYKYCNAPRRHPLEVCQATGLTQAQQVDATMGAKHDFKLSQLERLAEAREEPFKLMMLRALLTPEEYTKVMGCLNN